MKGYGRHGYIVGTKCEGGGGSKVEALSLFSDLALPLFGTFSHTFHLFVSCLCGSIKVRCSEDDSLETV